MWKNRYDIGGSGGIDKNFLKLPVNKVNDNKWLLPVPKIITTHYMPARRHYQQILWSTYQQNSVKYKQIYELSTRLLNLFKILKCNKLLLRTFIDIKVRNKMADRGQHQCIIELQQSRDS